MDDFPVKHEFIVTVYSAKDVSRTEILDALEERLEDLGYGQFWDSDNDRETMDVGGILVE